MDHQQVVSSLSPTAADDDGAANCTTTTELSSADPDVDLMTAPAVVKEAPCDTSSKNIDTTGRVVAAVNGHAKPAVVGAPNYTTKTCLNGDEHEEKEDERCGWGPFRPQFCQRFRNAKVVLLFLCILATIQGMVINGFVSVVISTIEKRFDLASRESGFIASGYDIASVICLIPVSYFGGVGHRPRWIAAGVLLLSLGSFLFVMPHFVTDFYTYDELATSDQTTCDWQLTATGENASEAEVAAAATKPPGRATSNLSRYMYIMVLAQMLHGAGGTPIYTLAVTYLNEGLKPKVAPMYLGVFYTTAIIGPAIGYILGGKLLEIYCDIGSVDMSTISLTPADSRWVGAWWIGFLISGCLSFLIAIPLSGFPKKLPSGSDQGDLQLESAGDCSSDGDSMSATKPGFRMSLREIPSSLKALLCNPTFMSLNLSGACEGLLISGFIVFTPKFVESQFSISAAWAAQLIGLVTIPSGGGGTFLGGYLVKRMNLRCRGILRLCMVTTSLALVLTLTLLFRCENIPFGGVNVDYVLRNRTLTAVSLTSTCNNACHCSFDYYSPVCGSDGITYFSPCFAGCLSYENGYGLKKYNNCSCVVSETGGGAMEGKCMSECQLLTMFLVIFAFIIFVTFTTSMPALAATLRCVPEKHRSFALGIQWILFRTLGMIPAPILFGALIDRACVSWQQASSAGDKGACLMYDNWAMGTYLLVLIVSCKALSFGFFCVALWRYRPLPGAGDPTPSTTTTSGTSCTVTETQPMVKVEQNAGGVEKT